MNRQHDFDSKALICLSICLLLLTLGVYYQVRHHDFVGFDDNLYVYENSNVRQGLTKAGIRWAFTTFHAYNWHPVTWLSHMLDVQLFGLDAGRHHLSSLFLHAANGLLLLFIFTNMTGCLWRSALVAALFALHPLHVESVAWIAERKDALSTFFGLLAVASYGHYTRQPTVKKYLGVVFFFVLGLMAKPMLVTLPFVLLLLDFWPMGRLSAATSGGFGKAIRGGTALMREKAPLFFIAALSILVTLVAQKSGGALKPLDALSLGERIGNALVSYIAYSGKMVWPIKLAVFYPHAGMPPSWKIAGAGLLLIGMTVLAIRWIEKRPYVAVGWFWYLGTLIPVIGIVQVGNQAMADRYTYIPLIGLYIIAAWGLGEWVQKRRRLMFWLVAATVICLTAFAVATWKQAGHWKNTTTLFRHALAVTSGNHLAHYNLGIALDKQGRLDQAAVEFEHVLRLRPDDYRAHTSLGAIFAKQGHPDKAARHFSAALRIQPDFAPAHFNLGNSLAAQGEFGRAIEHYRRALSSDPEAFETHVSLGAALLLAGNAGAAIGHYQKALEITPGSIKGMAGLALAYYQEKEYEKSLALYQKIDVIAPGRPEVSYNMACIYALLHRTAAAIRRLQQAIDSGYDNWGLIQTDPDLENIRGSEAYRMLQELYLKKKS